MHGKNAQGDEQDEVKRSWGRKAIDRCERRSVERRNGMPWAMQLPYFSVNQFRMAIGKDPPRSQNNNMSETWNYDIRSGGVIIRTTVTKEAAVVTQWVEEVKLLYGWAPTVVGLDVEWRPNFTRGMPQNKAALLQLCIKNKCLIMQLFYMDHIPFSIHAFLMDPNFTFVGVQVKDDIAKLRNEYGLDCCLSMDIKDKAMEIWPGRFTTMPGLKVLAKEICHFEIEKPKKISRSNWQKRFLSMEQVEYACIDAYASYSIGYHLQMGNLTGRPVDPAVRPVINPYHYPSMGNLTGRPVDPTVRPVINPYHYPSMGNLTGRPDINPYPYPSHTGMGRVVCTGRRVNPSTGA